MAWFKKNKKDIIDLTDMQKRGILQRARTTQAEIKPASQTSSDGYADLTGNTDIFGAIAGSSRNSNSLNARGSDTAVNNRLDDIEYKLENLRKKIDDILNRLEVVEKRANLYGK